MKTKEFTFTRNDKKYIISVEINDLNQVVVPYFKKLNDKIINIAFYPDQKTFVDDLRSLIPQNFNDNFLDFLKDVFFKTILAHTEKFGRITESDLDLYICEIILISDAIIKKHDNENLSYEEKCAFFENFKDDIVQKLKSNR